jgi:hypothetical protein
MFRIPGKFKGQCEVLHSWSIYHLSCLFHLLRPSWSWSRMVVEFYNYLCNRCLPPLKLWVRTPFMVRCTRYNIMWWSLSVTCDRSVVFSGYSSFLHQ